MNTREKAQNINLMNTNGENELWETSKGSNNEQKLALGFKLFWE